MMIGILGDLIYLFSCAVIHGVFLLYSYYLIVSLFTKTV